MPRLTCHSKRWTVYSTLLVALLLLVLWYPVGYHSVQAQQEEPSPIDIDLVAPVQAAPGELIEVQINYDTIDINAGADINYNLFGPARIWLRDPEPPNPIVNTWKPTWDNTKGTIKIQVLIEEGTDGGTLQHEVEIRWGPKAHKFRAETQIKFVPPTATPTMTPRPTRPKPTSTPEPAATAPVPALATLALTGATFVDQDGNTIETSQVNQEIALDISYSSTQDLENVSLVIRFDPDVINLDGAQYQAGEYTIALPSLPSAPDGASLFESPVQGHIRTFVDGGEQYELRATVQLVPAEGTTSSIPEEFIAEPIQINQPTLVEVTANVETTVVKTGGNIIVHVTCENPGSTPAKWFTLQIDELPEGFSVSPEEQTVDLVPENGGSVERLFTIRVPDGYKEPITFKAIAILEQGTVESVPVTVDLVSTTDLDIDVVARQATVSAGQVFYVDVMCTNDSPFGAQDVTVKLIDTTENLGVLFQDVGDIPAGESRQAVFVVQIPQEFATDAVVALAAQAVAGDGTISQSQTISVAVACVPVSGIKMQLPPGRVKGGQSAQVVVTVNNTSQCTAYDLIVSLHELPTGFFVPAAQTIAELAPGETRHLTFDVLVPEGYQGDVPLSAQVSNEQGTQAKTAQMIIVVGGVTPTFTILFGALVVIALAAVVVGTLLYFRSKRG